MSPFIIASGPNISGFTLTGQGATNANGVGLHVGDMLSGDIHDVDIDNFLGTNSSCLWLDNINGFSERNWFMMMNLGIAALGQHGCTKDIRFTNTGGSCCASFGHNQFHNVDMTVPGGGGTGISIEGGSVYDNVWAITGNISPGATQTWLSISGSSFTGSGVGANLDGDLFVTVECASPCASPGKLISTGASNPITLRSGEIRDSSTLLTNSILGPFTRSLNPPYTLTAAIEAPGIATSGANFSSNLFAVRGNYWNGSAGLADQWTIQNILGTGTNPPFTYSLAHAGSSSANFQVDFSSWPTGVQGLFVGGPPMNSSTGATTTGLAQFGHNSGTVSGVSGANYGVANSGVSFTQTVDNSGNMGIAGALADSAEASLTTTAATSDNVTVTGATASSHCSLTATNASAATNISTSFISAKATNQVTVTHTATASMTYDIRCSRN